MKKLIIFVFLFVLQVTTTENTYSKPVTAKKSNTSKTIVATENSDTSTISIDSVLQTKDSIISDREVSFDLVKLSKMASIAAFGRAGANKNGMVVIEVSVDSLGDIDGQIARDHSDKALVVPAMQAVKNYAKRYKLKPAIKDGKPIKQEGILLPIVFDMSMFEAKGDK